jgi:hypothetical protein
MPKVSLLERMRDNPMGNWTIGDVKRVCEEHGVECQPPTRGLHYKVLHGAVEEILTIPARRPLKPVYIRKLVKFIDLVVGRENDG